MLRAHAAVVHHVPGRVRLRLGPGFLSALGVDAGVAVDRLSRLNPGVLAVRVNATAASVTVHYDPRRLPPASWETLLQGPIQEATAVMTTYLTTVSDTQPPAPHLQE